MPKLLGALALLAMAGCADLSRDDQGVLQPQSVRGPCDVKKFFLLGFTAVHTDMTVGATGESCTFTVLNPALQAVPTAALVSTPPEHGHVTTAPSAGGRQVTITYTPQPGLAATDRFTVTIEPNDHAIAVAVLTR